MKILVLTLVNFKRMMKNKMVLALSFIMPMVVITTLYFIPSSGTEKNVSMVDVAFNILDKGEYGSKILKDLNMNKSIYYKCDERKIFKLLNNNDVVAVYVIPENFTEKIKKGEKPLVKAYKKQKGNGTTSIEMALDNEVNEKIKEQMFINKGLIKKGENIKNSHVSVNIKKPLEDIEGGLMLTIFMVVNFIIYSANGVGGEILQLRRERILSRSITTASKNCEVVGSLYIAMFLQMVTIYSLVYIVEKFIIGYSFKSAHIVFVSIMLMAAISVGLGVCITRVFQNESVVALVITLVGTANTFLATLGLSFQVKKVHWVIENIIKLTPQYWVFKSIDTGKIFPNAFVLVLMALVLFTAGNIKLRDFVYK